MSDNAPQDKGLSVDQFRAHVNAIQNTPINTPLRAVPMKRAINALIGSDANLPENPLVLTFEGAHRSVLDNAIPRLLKARIPFTIFISPGRIDAGSPNFMTFD